MHPHADHRRSTTTPRTLAEGQKSSCWGIRSQPGGPLRTRSPRLAPLSRSDLRIGHDRRVGSRTLWWVLLRVVLARVGVGVLERMLVLGPVFLFLLLLRAAVAVLAGILLPLGRASHRSQLRRVRAGIRRRGGIGRGGAGGRGRRRGGGAAFKKC